MSKSGGKGRVRNDLVAASCAAVLTVYAAGYWRTREAAGRLESQAQERRPAREVPPQEIIAQLPEPMPVVPPAPPPAQPVATPETKVAKEAPPKVASVSTPKPAKPPPAPTASPPAIMSVPLETEAPQAVSASAATPAPAAASTPPLDSLPVPKQKWKDGIYAGWGYSNHGDIEAEVTIREGRIAVARISRCATRYPCEVIDKLINQPVLRQSPDVDTVSRATESADAYYYGLVEALKQALVEDAPVDAATPSP